jgi:hypothetical protein
MPPLRQLVWIPVLLWSGCAQHSDIPILQAARLGDSQTLETLLSRGADPNQKDTGGLTPLILSARGGSAVAVETLLRHGADPELRGGVNGWTPLMHAVHKNQPGCRADIAGWRRTGGLPRPLRRNRADDGRRLRLSRRW